MARADEGREDDDGLVELARELRVTVHEVSRARVEREARTEAHQGIVARAAPLRERDLDDLSISAGKDPPFLVAIDGVTDPGNLGAILRSAEGAGVTGVILPRHRAAHITPTVTKTAAGAVEYLDFVVVPGLPAALSQLSDRHVWIVGLDAAGSRSVFELDLADEAVCVVLGAEDRGLSRLVQKRCDVLASLPMRGQLDSLNVSAAAAIALYEVVRRRSL